MRAMQTTKAVDAELAGLRRRGAVLERDRHRLDAQVADAESALARAVKRGTPVAGIAQAQADLRELREQRGGVVAALELIQQEAEALEAERGALSRDEAIQTLANAEEANIRAMDRAHAALHDVLHREVAPVLALHTEAQLAWRRVDHALADLRRVSPDDVPATLRRDGCTGRWPSLALTVALRSYLARDAGAVGAPPAPPSG